jgi:uncharacterized protein involved in exopolysaccharide biosynthesis
MLGLIAAVLRHWRSVLLFAALVALAVVIPTLLKRRLYEVTTSFVPQTRKSAGNLSGIAAQLGINFPQSEGGQTPQFYAELLKSSEMLRNVVTAKMSLAGAGATRLEGTLVDAVRRKHPEASDALLVELAIQRLRERLAVGISAKTGLVTLAVRDEDPLLARDIAARLIQELNRFNLVTRQSQAAAERRFTEQRLAEASIALRSAEERRQQFASQNRGFGDASRLNLERERLTRAVDNAQQVYSMLVTAFEQSKIDEVRDTPVITIIEPPRAPVSPVSRGLALRGLVGLLSGLTLGILFALMRARLQELKNARVPGWMALEATLPRRGKRAGELPATSELP